MENNANYFNAAVLMVEAASWLKDVDNDLASYLIEKADQLKDRIVILDQKELEEVKKYEQLLKSK